MTVKKSMVEASRKHLPPLQNPFAELKAALRAALMAVPTADSLKHLYSSEADREKVVRRLMLKATLNLVFDEVLSDPDAATNDDGSIDIDISDRVGITLFASLSAAIRDFAHDSSMLDQGLKAELILAPVDHEEDDQPQLISADRKIVLLALLFIETKKVGVTEKRQLEIASEYTGIEVSTLRTYVRNMRKAAASYKTSDIRGNLAFSKAEYDYYMSALHRMESIVGRGQRTMIAELIGPALRGLGSKHQAIRPKKTQKRVI